MVVTTTRIAFCVDRTHRGKNGNGGDNAATPSDENDFVAPSPAPASSDAGEPRVWYGTAVPVLIAVYLFAICRFGRPNREPLWPICD